jgi:DNA-binding IclR family transcriptional regulator
MRAAPNRAKIVDMLGLLVRAPRTVAELSELTGVSRYGIYPWLTLMMEEGLLRRESVNFRECRGRIFRYHWNK